MSKLLTNIANNLLAAMALLVFVLPLQLLAAPVSSGSARSNPIKADAAQSGEAIMQQFAGGDEESPQRKVLTKTKHQILFLMGLSLLVLLLTTGALGVAMVVFGKDVFLPHMIFAGLSMTLAVVHSATAIAWFWPY